MIHIIPCKCAERVQVCPCCGGARPRPPEAYEIRPAFVPYVPRPAWGDHKETRCHGNRNET